MSNRSLSWVLLLGAVVGAGALAVVTSPKPAPAPAPAPKPAPKPKPQPKPQPKPKPKPCPGPGPCPRAAAAGCPSVGGIGWAKRFGAAVGGRDDTIACDLPGDLHQQNTGGSDGAGLCVFCSMHHAGLWQNDLAFAGLFDWMKNHPGGGYPEKVDKMLEQYCSEMGLPKPDYLQVEGKDLEVLKLACASGRMPCVTYSHSPTGRYGGQKIAHMVNLVRADDREFWVLDNNYIGEDAYEKMTPEEFSKAYGSGWAIILLNPAPPPPPHNFPR